MMYITYVLVPRDTEKIEYEVLDFMYPYCEEVEDEEYERPCECVDLEVCRRLEHLAEIKFGDLRRRWEKLSENADPEEAEIIWDNLIRDYLRFVNSHYGRLCQAISPDPDCPECEGKGWEISTFNRIGRWDGWLFDRSFQVLEDDSDDSLVVQTRPKLPGFYYDQIGQPRIYDLNDIDITSVRVPYAILSPDGWDGCTERTKIGSVQVPDQIWTKSVRKILGDYSDYLLVPLECHV